MKRRRTRTLTEEDRTLWSTVARTVTPLHGPTVAPEARADENPPAPTADTPVARLQAAIPRAAPATAPLPGSFDRPTSRKIARGRIGIEGRIDLHDMTQEQAHGALLAFVRRARAEGSRHVLVITGKGGSGTGILRRMVPAWLRTAPFREQVGAFDGAAPHHGGEGAIYLRLRRPKAKP